jgi:RNA polymerase sigma-70 factor (ECF subfamily)
MRSEAATLAIQGTNMRAGETLAEQAKGERQNVDPSKWVDDHGDALFRFAFVRVRDEAAAEDLVQDTLLSAIQSIEKFDGASSVRTWLVGILKHKIIDHYRKNSRHIQLAEEDTDLSDFDGFFSRPDKWDGHWVIALRPVDPEQSPDQVIERGEFWEVMNRCLSALPEKIANVFALREIDGMSSDEICTALDLSANNFWVIMHRARMQLRRCIEIKWFKHPI